MKIGFFDSGIGGITVARSVSRAHPHYAYVYHADDTNMPYGEKDPETLYQLTTNALWELFSKQQCALVILACNTATTILPRIQQEWLPVHFPRRKVLGVIRPTVEHMTQKYHKHPIYLLATTRTVLSDAYTHELHKIKKACEFHQIACPKLAELVEQSDNPLHDPAVSALCKSYVDQIPEGVPLTIYTGCTHYAYTAPYIRSLRPLAHVINQGHLVGIALQAYLERHPELHARITKTNDAEMIAYCSSAKERAIKRMRRLLHN